MRYQRFKIHLFVCILGSILFLNCKNRSKQLTENWTPLFNGIDLSDWIIKIKGHPLGENYKNTFIVEDGVLKVNYKDYDSFNNTFGHIYYKTPFSNYKFRMQYRFTGEQLKGGEDWATRNSGIMVHCEDPGQIGLNQNFPVSIEVQLLGGLNSGHRSTGNLYTPVTHVVINDSLFTPHCTNSSSETYNGNQWVAVEIEVRNDSIIKHFINGKKVLTYFKPQIGGPVDYNYDYWKSKEGTALKAGYIALQSESHPVEFKNIYLLEL
ncbi:3-keto-disaccharide hydrolase [Aestuariivivens sediminicola]|uniref:3-keto-disaccharide hydrolase n=1 Tax=Aestuariivivens sediminicola TaxID=2913560 RepID=UPI001F55F0E3|nr:DUF1080 domain-containing protein [Aestuariivivens sediminicola]